MRSHRLRRVAALAACGAAAIAAGAPAARAATGIIEVADAVPGSYVVTLDVPRAEVAAAARRLTARANGRLGFVYRHALRGFSLRASRDGALAIARSPRVRRVQQDARYSVGGTQTGGPYGLDRIDQRSLPLNNTYTYANDGAGVHAYVLDTGIRPSHRDFEGRATAGADFVGDGRGGIDCHGHGTHVAGTTGGETYGDAKGARLVGVRVLDCGGSGSTSGITAGIDWVTANAAKPAVANMSLGTAFGRDSTIDAAVARSINSGISYAIAAGNGLGNGLGIAQDACDVSPANVPAALTVSATDSSDTKPGWANTGTCVDLFAPGVNTVSASHSSDTGTATMSGTSMSSPHVAGAAALYLAANPAATPAQVSSALNSNATAGVVRSPGSGSPNRLLYTAFIGSGGTANQPPAAGFTSSCSGLTCTFADTSTDADGTIVARSWSFGDGATSTAANPSHTYAAAGTYTVTLTVTDDRGASATTSRTLTVGSTADPDPATPTLTSGVSRTGTSAAAGGFVYLKIAVPAGASSLRVDLTGPSCGLLGCNPDLDLFLRRGAKPTRTVRDASSETGSNAETVTISSPAADWYYVGVYTYSGSSGASFSVRATVG